MRLPCASFTVAVSVVVLVPSAVTIPGSALTDEVLLLGVPGTNVTPNDLLIAPSVAVTVFDSATVEAKAALKTPDAFVVPLDGVNVLLVPVLAKLTA
jgi:hypothetical protein